MLLSSRNPLMNTILPEQVDILLVGLGPESLQVGMA